MKRSALSRGPHRPKPKAHPADLPKNTGQRLVDKNGHRRSRQHLELVRAQACLISRHMGPEIEAHHAREMFDRTMGRRPSDFLTVPLRKCWHDPNYPGSLHHTGSGAAWWLTWRVDPLSWIRGFLMRHYKPGQSKGADEALALVMARIASRGEGR